MLLAPPETERLRLRLYSLADEPALYQVFADSYARGFYPEMGDHIKVRRWIEWNLWNYDEFGFGLWAVELKSSGEFIGDCGLTYQSVEGDRELEIGYHIVEGARGKGYATEAARACLESGFRGTEAATICSIVRTANIASRTVAGRVHRDCREFVWKERPALLFYTMRRDWRLSAPGGSPAAGPKP